jgi:predicted nucleotidyltransferase
MSPDDAIALLRARSDEVRGYGIRSLFLFGSTARGEAGPQSDVDLFVDYDAERFGLIELARLRSRLSEVLGRPADVTTRDALHPLLEQRIVREAVQVF